MSRIVFDRAALAFLRSIRRNYEIVPIFDRSWYAAWKTFVDNCY